MSKDYKVQWTPELREAVDNRIIDYLSQGYSQQEAEEKALLDLLDHTTFNFSEDVVVTAKAPEKKQVAVETDWDPGYTKFISGKRYYADKNHKNYLDWLRNDMTNSIRETTDKWGHAIGSGIEIASGFTPLWWVAPAVRTGLDLSEGDYKGAALNAGLAFAAPYAVGKGILYITPYAKSAIIASKLNRQINKTKLYPKNERIVEKLPDYLYHNEFFKWPDRILNPKHSTTNQIGKQLHSAKPAKYDYIWWDKGMKSYPEGPIVRVQKPTKLELHPNTQEVPGITGLYINDNYYVTPALHTNIDNMVTFRQLPDGSLAPYSTNRILNNRMSLDEMFLLPITSQSTQNGITSKTSLAFFEKSPAETSSASVSPTTNIKLTNHLQGDDAARMFNEYAKGYTLPATETENIRLLRAYVAEARERYGLVGNDEVSDETILKALYKHVDELGGNTAARNIDGEPQLLFRGDTKAYTTLRTNHADAGGTPDNILGTLFLGELPHSLGDMGVYRYLVRGTDFRGTPQVLGAGAGSLARPIINNQVLKLAETEGRKGEAVLSFPAGTRKVIEYPKTGYNVYKLPSSASSTGVNDVNAFVVRTPAVRDVTNELVVAAGTNSGVPPKLDWLVPVEDRIGKSLNDVWKSQNHRIILEAQKANQGLLKSNRGSYWRGDEHAAYDYFALPDANVQNAKHILPYDFRIPRNWLDPNIFRVVVPTALTLGGVGTAIHKSTDNKLLN